MIIKLILICLSNSFFNFFIKMKNVKRNVFRFPFFYENEKRMKVLKIQRKNLLSMEMVVNYFNFVFLNEVKSKSKYRILNFVFQFIKNTQWHFGYTNSEAQLEPRQISARLIIWSFPFRTEFLRLFWVTVSEAAVRKCSLKKFAKLCKIHRKTPETESLFSTIFSSYWNYF